MATISVDVDVDIDIEDHLDEVSTEMLAETLAERTRAQALSALQSHGLISLAEDSEDMTDIENIIHAFNTRDRTLFEISLNNLFPTAKTQITFTLRQKQRALAAA